ncbi:MAG: T9SS type A sorting domain-containing protein [Ignavibacteria bacterium]|nr:T9SS type A sorting domain-containing protein [Ignavibacteria bacterium]
MKISKVLIVVFVVISSFVLYQSLEAFSSGITGRTKKNGDGCTCHGSTPTAGVSAIISGPASVKAGDTATYRLKLFGGPLVGGGCNIAAQTGTLMTSFLESQLQLISGELTHTSPKLSVGGDTIRWAFKYKAPNAPNTKDSIFANGNSVNMVAGSSGDAWNFANNFVINITPATSIEKNSEIVKEFKLSQNYPNPFNPATKINFSVLKSGFVTLRVFDNLGRERASLVNENLNSGSYSYVLDANAYGLASGMYYYKLETDGFSDTKKMILAK